MNNNARNRKDSNFSSSKLGLFQIKTLFSYEIFTDYQGAYILI